MEGRSAPGLISPTVAHNPPELESQSAVQQLSAARSIARFRLKGVAPPITFAALAMLKPHEIFGQMPAAVAEELLAFLFEKEKPLYKATIESLAKQRKLRPVFVERKTRPDRHEWLRANLAKKSNEPIAAQLLQIWLVGAHRELLCHFLDELGIKHDENGTIEALPPAPEKQQLTAAVETLLVRHEPRLVAVYLHAFQAFDEEGWPSLEQLLAEDPRLRLEGAAPLSE